MSELHLSASREVTEEVDAPLKKYLFVEMHGNAEVDVPPDPRCPVRTDDEDLLSHKPLTDSGELGLSEANKDDRSDVVYVDYDGPFNNFDVHNLAAADVHAVKETLRLNEVCSSQELYEKAQSGVQILMA